MTQIVETRDQVIRMIINLAASVVVIVPTMWFGLQPLVADETRIVVQEEIYTLTSAFEIIMMDSIKRLRVQIADLEYARSQDLEVYNDELVWTQQENRELSSLQNELTSKLEALAALNGQRRHGRRED